MVVGQIEDPLDFAVVGAGPGGYAAALRAAQLGRKVTLIDRDGADGVGGVCLRVGCIPSKALIEAAELAQRTRDAANMGINATLNAIDMPRIQNWKGEIISSLTDGVRKLLKQADVEIAAGDFHFTGAKTGVITADDGLPRFVHFEDLVLATGSRPVTLADLPINDKTICDSTGALALNHVPKTIAVIGGGYIGLEIGTAFAKLGAAITIVEAESRVLPTMDAHLTRPVARRLKALGVEVKLGTQALGHSRGKLAISDGKDETKIPADVVVVAVGRRPNTDDLGLDLTDLRSDETGLFTVADDRRVAPHIAAIGDITPGRALAHKATAEAQVAAEALCGRNTAFVAGSVPAVVFSDPEIATVGLSEAEAKAEGMEPLAARFPLAASGRGRTINASEGFVEIIADKADERVLGVHIVGPHASELIAEGAVAIEMGAGLEDVALTIHPHPTLSEQVAEAAHVALGRPIHISAPKKRNTSKS
jgi:dihydrolipoamide dehydrogenase